MPRLKLTPDEREAAKRKKRENQRLKYQNLTETQKKSKNERRREFRNIRNDQRAITEERDLRPSPQHPTEKRKGDFSDDLTLRKKKKTHELYLNMKNARSTEEEDFHKKLNLERVRKHRLKTKCRPGQLYTKNLSTDCGNMELGLCNQLASKSSTPGFHPLPQRQDDITETHDCGPMDFECQFCGALHFEKEQPPDKKFTQCCRKGKVIIQKVKTSPLLTSLMTNSHFHSKNFMDNIRSINNALAFASMGANLAPPPGNGPYCFKICGQIYHRTGALHPVNNDARKFAQLYILDPEEACVQRMKIKANSACDPELINELSIFMAHNNPFAKAFKMMHEVEKESIAEAHKNHTEPTTITMSIFQDRNSDPRRYNSQHINEVAIVFQHADGEPPLERDLIIHCRSCNDNRVKRNERISILDPNLDAMIYPLLFPFGDQSWSPNLKLNYAPPSLQNVQSTRPTTSRIRIKQMQYYSYIFSVRNEFYPFLNAGKLTQQYFVDSYVRMEGNRLNYIRLNQSKLRVDKYTGLMDFLQSEAAQQGLLPGIPVILPSSFAGSPRNMAQNFQDAMAIVRKYGKPDFFVTMTCNPKWPEIINNLNGQKSEFRPDLIARIFRLKLDELLDDIKKKHVFGVPVAIIHVIEFQKRGLPHAHILVIMRAEDKPKDIDSIDRIISAEIPDPVASPALYSIIIKHMIHGPCGESFLNSPCMVDKKCTKKFPKTFQSTTTIDSNGYPNYKRPNNKQININGRLIDNSLVVPYSPILCLKYNCHINVESCISIKSVKYLFKYIYKGHDCANLTIKEQGILGRDEIKTFLDSRYVSAPEAAWRIFGFTMHEQSHAIIRLQVHLPGEHSVYFTEDNMNFVADQNSNKDTTLTAWFKLNQVDNTARQYLYSEIPVHYVFDKKSRSWTKRIKNADNTIGRMYSVHFKTDHERFCLRLLLLHIRGAMSFHNLLTVNDITYKTFKEAAQRHGLFEDDEMWKNTLLEAASEKMPKHLRELFAYICIETVPSNLPTLFHEFKSLMWEDYSRHDGHNEMCKICENTVLRDIQDILRLHRKSLLDVHLPTPTQTFHAKKLSSQNNLNYQRQAHVLIQSLTTEQTSIFNEIVNANNLEESNCYFLDGPGGSGKTYLYETLLSHFRSKLMIAIAVASTGIAANLLSEGRTSHSQFGLPVPILENSVSTIMETSLDAKNLKNAEIIIFDESTIALSNSLKCIDRLLQTVMQNKITFGGKRFILGGDFRQILPVVRHGSRVEIVGASVKCNEQWPKFKHLHLSNNVRSVDNTFSDWLIKIGNGTLTNEHGLAEDIIEIPENMLCTGSLVGDIFGTYINSTNIKQLAKRAILSPKNKDVDEINENVLSLIEGELVTYLSIDSIVDADSNDRTNYPTEFLNDLTPSGMPPHRLNLKINSIVMLLRNLNTKKGLCNGTRLVVKELKPNLIICEVLTGKAKDQIVFIPRIDLAPKDTELPFILQRRQFPLKLAFAMTINKSQGQTLEKVGIYLPDPVFSHGQLYVAISRVRCSEDVKFQIVDGAEQGRLIPDCNKIFTKNVVYKEIFSK